MGAIASPFRMTYFLKCFPAEPMLLSSLLKKGLFFITLALVVLLFLQRDLVLAAFQTNPFQGSIESVARGEQIWTLNCLSCHGPAGSGDGPASALLTKRPKDLTMVASPPFFPDGIMAFRIAHGKNTMPAWQDALTPDEIWDLVSFIRSKANRTS
jgi:mono/diheme cytochrome c family protein